MQPDKSGPSGAPEIVGTVKRVLRRKLGDTDRADIDRAIHSLLGARGGVERQHKRAAAAAGKLRKRLAAITAQLDELHGQWKEPEIEAVVECRVERTASELRLVRTDTNLVYTRRKLTREEVEALGSTLPHMPDRARVKHAELDPDADVAKHEEKRREAEAERGQLAKPITLEDVFAEIDSEAEGADEPDDAEKPATKAKRPRKGKRAVNQPDLPMNDQGKKP